MAVDPATENVAFKQSHEPFWPEGPFQGKAQSSLRTRLIMGMAIMLVPVVVIALTSFFSLRNVVGKFEEAEEETNEELSPVIQLELIIPDAILSVHRYLENSSSDEVEKFNTRSREVDDTFQQALAGPIGLSEERELVSSAQAEWQQAESLGREIFARPDASADPTVAQDLQRLDDQVDQASAHLKSFEGLAREEIEEALASAQAARTRALLLIVGVSMAGLFVALTVAFGLARSILSPLNKLKEAVRHLGAGELSHRVAVGTTDELGALAGTFNVMAQRLEADQQMLSHMSTHDALTGLCNQREFFRRSEEVIERCRTSGRPLSLLFVDLDDFKAINDSLGHAAGDQILVGLSQMLREQVRKSDILARLGGDEFVVLLPGANVRRAQGAAETMLQALREHTAVIDGTPVRTTASIGIAPLPNGDANYEELLVHADIAMYEVKRRGGNGVWLYQSTDGTEALAESRLTWKRRIREALEQDLFLLYWQPIIDLEDDHIEQYEMLLRLKGDEGELLYPGSFLGIAERLGLDVDIDRWVVGQALFFLGQEQERHHEINLAINLSARALTDYDLLQFIHNEIKTNHVDPTHLIFEITESAAIVDMKQTLKFISSLKEIGCRFSLDDFGVGFASFYELKHLPLDYLKIDGHFIRHLATEKVDQNFVKAIVQVARAAKVKTIAEWVENEQTLTLLRQFKADYVQGYHLGRPEPVLEIPRKRSQTSDRSLTPST